jgi:tRNA modification GTPase
VIAAFEPIAAIATPLQPSAVAMLRLSGLDVHAIAIKFLERRNGQKPCPTPNKMQYLNVKQGDLVLDDVVVCFYKNPRSFTGEDAVEIFCHGGPYIVQAILQLAIQSGCREAQPGEFTKRAMLHGKMDLTAAEGVKDLIEATTHQQWISGRQLYSGRLKLLIESLRTEVVESMAYLEAMIDFPDEGDTAHVNLSHVIPRLEKVRSTIQKLASSFQSGKVASQGLLVAFAGPPNAGKSSLFNSLLGHDRAIVSAIPGTTRDYLEERCHINGRLVRLVDLAGIRHSNDEIEKLGIERSQKLIQEADVIVLLCPTNPSDDDLKTCRMIEAEILQENAKAHILKVLTKSDLTPHSTDSYLDRFMNISVVTEAGMGPFKASLSQYVDQLVSKVKDIPFITSQRHFSALQESLNHLANFSSLVEQKGDVELLAFELQMVAKSVQSVIGELSSEDILDKVFSTFCIGK